MFLTQSQTLIWHVLSALDCRLHDDQAPYTRSVWELIGWPLVLDPWLLTPGPWPLARFGNRNWPLTSDQESWELIGFIGTIQSPRKIQLSVTDNRERLIVTYAHRLTSMGRVVTSYWHQRTDDRLRGKWYGHSLTNSMFETRNLSVSLIQRTYPLCYP
jgi:hypothetical protein